MTSSPGVDLHRLDASTWPVDDCIDALRTALAEPGVAVLQAEPGAGKTTVVPLRLVDEGWLGGRRIVVLEPRRLAARAAARRMAALLGEPVGRTVGFRTRDERQVGPTTRIEVVTEGILTRRLQHDPSLDGIGLVMFDEFHERNLTADVGLAFTLEARRALRSDLRILVASATLDGGNVAALLGGPAAPAPIVASRGRQHPVELVWRPPAPRQALETTVAAAVRRVLAELPDGDVLVFLPGAAAIERTARRLADPALPGDRPVDVRQLFGALDAADQDAALAPAPAGRRKVVLATDIAETSLTVEGVRIVIDAGLTRTPRFDPRTGMTRLETVDISRASADQRAGRAGRTAPGRAIRLWSSPEHTSRRAFTPPEITQVDLAAFALELAEWGTHDPAQLSLLDQPPPAAWARATALLHDLEALDDADRVTATGRAMAELPLHPRSSAIVLAGMAGGLGWTACALAALLDERDVLRGRPDEVPVDLAERLGLLDDTRRRHPHADAGALHRARRRARELARRAGVRPGDVDHHQAGRLLLAGYPDRLARARERDPAATTAGYVLRTGAGAWLAATDPLAAEELLVVADLDGDRRNARIRQAAAIDLDDALEVLGGHVHERHDLVWDTSRNDLVARTERRLDQLVLGSTTGPPMPGPATTAALVDRVRTAGLGLLTWTPQARDLQQRVAFVGERRGRGPGDDGWPDLGDDALLADLDRWLAPMLAGARRRADLEAIDVATALTVRLGHHQQRALDRLAPRTVTLPGADRRRVTLDYSSGRPVLALRVQELFGTTTTPTVLDGAEPVVLHLLSPAGRPLQITTDLAGFWAGSWREVRKEMAGRYPKHAWPDDPAHASPPARRSRRR